jgi:hypothetical protein
MGRKPLKIFQPVNEKQSWKTEPNMAHFGDFLNAKNPLESSYISEMIIIF